MSWANILDRYVDSSAFLR